MKWASSQGPENHSKLMQCPGLFMRGVTGYHGWVEPMLEPVFLLRKAGRDPGAKNMAWQMALLQRNFMPAS